MNDDEKRRYDMSHVLHVWINGRQQQRHANNEPWEQSLYEWKSAQEELRRLPIWLKRLREDDLPAVHQQCSHSAPEPIAENHLICALGVNVAECPIVASVYATVKEHRERERFPYNLTDEDADQMVASVCCWHIFTEKLTSKPYIDTSEGYYQDESDRRFWSNVYTSLSGKLEHDTHQPGNADGQIEPR